MYNRVDSIVLFQVNIYLFMYFTHIVTKRMENYEELLIQQFVNNAAISIIPWTSSYGYIILLMTECL